MNVRVILVVKSESLGEGLGEKGSLASMGWLVPLYEETSARMEGGGGEPYISGSSENKDARLEDENLPLVDYGIASAILTVPGFMASTKDGSPPP